MLHNKQAVEKAAELIEVKSRSVQFPWAIYTSFSKSWPRGASSPVRGCVVKKYLSYGAVGRGPAPPLGKGRWQASPAGTCSCRWAESASWILTSSWETAGLGWCTEPLPPAEGDRDLVMSPVSANTQTHRASALSPGGAHHMKCSCLPRTAPCCDSHLSRMALQHC